VAITFYIPGPLRAFSGGSAAVQIDSPCATLRDALEALFTKCPGIRDRLVNEEGSLREHVNIFVGTENIRYTGDFATPLRGETQISIIPSISGGVEEKQIPQA
jgi:sulfur-carrier protein